MLASRVLPVEMRYLTSLALRQQQQLAPLTLSLGRTSSPALASVRAHPRAGISSLSAVSHLAFSRPSSGSETDAGRILPQRRSFHVSARREAPLPLLLPFLGFMKSSFFISCVTTGTRILVSFLPLHLFTFIRSLKKLRRYDPLNPQHLQSRPNVSPLALSIHYNSPRSSPSYPSYPTSPAQSSFSSPMLQPSIPPELQAELAKLKAWEKRGERLFKKKVWARRLIITTLLGPLVVFGLVVGAGLERTPLTGRWRVLLISPEEEDTIHKGLLETGWFQAVLDILVPSSQDGTPPAPISIVPADDWRWDWVESNLRRLEAGAQACHDRHYDPSASLSIPSDPVDPNFPPPPPPQYPLHPRPRVSQILHHSCLCLSSDPPPPDPVDAGQPPRLDGPPYQLLLIDSPQANAFSYGFGGEGAAGVVVQTGMLDEILGCSSQPIASSTPPARRSLFSLFSPSPSSSNLPGTQPTEEQTLHLSSILAHEMSHLLLSHHLETLSYSSVLLPSALNLTADLLRTILFPITFILGPFVNDALGNLSHSAHGHLKLMTESCSSQALEIEADKVGLRILAEAGFDPFEAAKFWSVEKKAPAVPAHLEGLNKVTEGKHWTKGGRGGGSHPTDEVRARAVRAELDRWKSEWRERMGSEATPIRPVVD